MALWSPVAGFGPPPVAVLRPGMVVVHGHQIIVPGVEMNNPVELIVDSRGRPVALRQRRITINIPGGQQALLLAALADHQSSSSSGHHGGYHHHGGGGGSNSIGESSAERDRRLRREREQAEIDRRQRELDRCQTELNRQRESERNRQERERDDLATQLARLDFNLRHGSGARAPPTYNGITSAQAMNAIMGMRAVHRHPY